MKNGTTTKEPSDSNAITLPAAAQQPDTVKIKHWPRPSQHLTTTSPQPPHWPA